MARGGRSAGLTPEAAPSLLRTLGRLLFGLLLVLSILIFILWRTDNPRLQALRLAAIDRIAPSLEALAGPSNALSQMIRDFESYAELQEENERLRRRTERLLAWREVAERLEEENARLRALNQVKLPPRIGFVTAEVIADAGSPYSQSILVNVGGGDGVEDGAPAVDANGLIGRVVGVGEQSARILLLTDINSRAPVFVGEARERAMLRGDNTDAPALDYAFEPEKIRVGDRVVTSGEGGVFPAGINVGRVLPPEPDQGDERPRVALAADLLRLDFLRLYRKGTRRLAPPEGELILGDAPFTTAPAETPAAASADN